MGALNIDLHVSGSVAHDGGQEAGGGRGCGGHCWRPWQAQQLHGQPGESSEISIEPICNTCTVQATFLFPWPGLDNGKLLLQLPYCPSCIGIWASVLQQVDLWVPSDGFITAG